MESLEHRGGSNRFLLCFRPLPMAGSLKPDSSQRNSADQVLAYIAVGDKDRHGVVVPAILSPLSGDNRQVSAQDFSPARRKNRCFTKSVSKVLKSVFFDASLMKRIRSKKSQKNSFQTVNSAQNEKFSNLIGENSRAQEPLEIQCGTDDRRTNSALLRPQSSASAGHLLSASICPKCSSSPTSTSTSTSSLSFSPRKSSSSLKKQSVRHHTHAAKLILKRASYTGLCLFLVSLSALVFWGKICAIFCASTWLLLLPHYNHESMRLDHRDSPDHRQRSGHRPSLDHRDSPGHHPSLDLRPSLDHRLFLDHRGLPDFESVEHKKKVVMGGLLERNHRRRNTHTASFLSSKF